MRRLAAQMRTKLEILDVTMFRYAFGEGRRRAERSWQQRIFRDRCQRAVGRWTWFGRGILFSFGTIDFCFLAGSYRVCFGEQRVHHGFASRHEYLDNVSLQICQRYPRWSARLHCALLLPLLDPSTPRTFKTNLNSLRLPSIFRGNSPLNNTLASLALPLHIYIL